MTSISFPAIKDMTQEYLNGDSIAKISIKYGVSPKTVKEYVGISPKTRTEIEEKFFKERLEAENIAIVETKDKFFKLIQSTMDEALSLPIDDDNKHKLITALTKPMENMDKNIRLNRDMSTENITKKEQVTKIDVAKIIKELKSPEDKRRFLQEQIIDVEPENE